MTTKLSTAQFEAMLQALKTPCHIDSSITHEQWDALANAPPGLYQTELPDGTRLVVLIQDNATYTIAEEGEAP